MVFLFNGVTFDSRLEIEVSIGRGSMKISTTTYVTLMLVIHGEIFS